MAVHGEDAPLLFYHEWTHIVRQFPIDVTIRTPMHTPRLRGVQARGPHALGPLGTNLRVRISRLDRELIESIAEELGMSKAEFCRWCALRVAEELQPK